VPARTLSRIVYALLLVLFFGYIALAIYDGFAHTFGDARSGCRVEVWDVYGLLMPAPDLGGDVCWYNGMSVYDARRLGRTVADRIIIVTHYFENNTEHLYGIGTSDPVDLTWFVLHPVSALHVFKGQVQGTNESWLALKPSIWDWSASLEGKEVILIVCSMPSTKYYASVMVERSGADVVAYSKIIALTPELAAKAVTQALEAEDINALCEAHPEYFECVRGGGD